MEREPFHPREIIVPFLDLATMVSVAIVTFYVRYRQLYGTVPNSEVPQNTGAAFFLVILYILIISVTVAPEFSPWRRFMVLIVLTFMVASAVLLFASYYAYLGLYDVRHGVITHDRATGLYFSTTTWTSLGLGDYVPNDENGRAVVAEETVAAHVVTALYFVAFVSLLANRIINREGGSTV